MKVSENRMKRTNIYLSERQVERLRVQAEQDHVPVAELVRRAIDVYLAWHDPTYAPAPSRPKRKKHSSPA